MKLTSFKCFGYILFLVLIPGALPYGSVSIPADYTGDQKVTLADFSAVANDWSETASMDSLDRLAFHWLMDATNNTDVTIGNVYTDQARYEPGQVCTISAECRNNAADVFQGRLGIYITRHGRPVYSGMQTISIGGFGGLTKQFQWTVPLDDFQGYLVEAWLDNGACGVTAIDVSSDWKRYPRYGYITEFYASTPTTRNTEMLNQLQRDYHINCLQYYDWMWRHENVIKRDYAGTVISPWSDWRGADIAFEILQDSIAKANARKMATLPYFQIYMGLDNYESISGVSPQWGLYADTTHMQQYHHDAGVAMWLFNPANVDWQNHLCGQYTDALTSLNWSGIHLDQLGNIGGGNYFDYWGHSIDLEWALGNMVNRSKDHLDYLEAINPTMVGRDAVIFNIVDGGVGKWGVDAILDGKTDVVYSELWSNGTYGGVSDFVRYAKTHSDGKPVVLAAYMNRYEDTGGYFDADSVLLADAAFSAAGASHLELGDGTYMLSQEFFPARDKLVADGLRTRLKDYYNFITAYERRLFAPDLRFGDGGLQWISTPEHTLSGNGGGNTLWFLNRGTADVEIFHLINLLGNDNQWRNIADAPPILQDIPITLRLGPNAQVHRVWLASPDSNGGIMRPLDFTTGIDTKGDFLAVTLDRLEYWDMICIERTVQVPTGNRYEAEEAIKQDVGVNTDHGGYSGSGFVDHYAEVNDSVNFYVTVPEAGTYAFNFRYANGSSAATRSLIVDGQIQDNVHFPSLGHWDTWATAEQSVYLKPGVHQVTLYYGNWNSGAINLDYLHVE